MDFSEEWKSPWPISSSSASPLLISEPVAGPLIFNPIPKTLTHLFTSPSLSPLSSLSPLPNLSLSRFLLTSSLIPPTLSSSLSHQFDPEDHKFDVSSTVVYNCLQLLRCPINNTVLVFFPTGENSDRVGFVELLVKKSNVSVRVDEDSGCGNVYMSKNKFNHRIVKILVNPIAASTKGNALTVGCLLVCTLYSVHWFSVEIKGLGSESERPSLVYLNGKVFKRCAIVNACWNPHLPEESIVMLESGELFLFNLDSCLINRNLNAKFKGTRLKISFDDQGSSGKRKWLGCHFSWHPKILIVACSDAVFLVDLRFAECKLSCLANIEWLRMTGKNKFVAFSKADSDGYYFTVATNHLLLLFDIRKPLMPVLQWVHNLDNPCFIDVFRLSELRSHSMDDKYKFASESGFCIIIGSFWNSEFCLFCYGPSIPTLSSGSVSSKISKFYKSLYAWELPSELLISGHECRCGGCLTREEFMKDALPEWTDWQQKKEVVLGFGILDKDVTRKLYEPDEFGGFTLIRLVSSGKLEVQRYCASWDYAEFKEAHKDSSLDVENYFLYSMGDEEYKFPKRFKYLKLDYLYSFLHGNLFDVLGSKFKKPCKDPPENDFFTEDFHEILCEKLKACGIIQARSSPAVSDVLKDVSLPTSIHELAVRRMWAGLPMDLLQLAFSSYPELLEVLVDKKKVSLEFLAVPGQPQLPPFFLRKPSVRSNKWSNKVQRGNDLVGPVLPLPILHNLHDIRNNGCLNSQEGNRYQFEMELTIHCNEVKQAANEMAVLDSGSDILGNRAVSLADDREDPWGGSQKSKPFLIYKQDAFSDKCSNREFSGDNSDGDKDEKFATLISKFHENDLENRIEIVGLELFDDLCPVELKFDTQTMKFRPKELKAYKMLKRQFSKSQQGLDSYRDFCNQSKFHRK